MQDTRIQCRLVKEQTRALGKMYPKGFKHLKDYIAMKSRHMLVQQRNKWKLDVPATEALQNCSGEN